MAAPEKMNWQKKFLSLFLIKTWCKKWQYLSCKQVARGYSTWKNICSEDTV